MHWTFEHFMKAREFSFNNKESIQNSQKAACYCCMNFLNATDIKDYTSDDNSAICPICGTDAVIGDASGQPIDIMQFLEHMNWYGFCHVDVNGSIRVTARPQCLKCYLQTEDAFFEK